MLHPLEFRDMSASKVVTPNLLQGPEFTRGLDETSLGHLFFKNSEKYANRLCQIDAATGETETYASVHQRSIRVASQLQQRGITPKDVIAVCSSNTIDNTIPMLAGFYLGAKVANLQVTPSVRHTKQLLTSVKPSVIFIEESSVHVIEESLVDCQFKPDIIVFGVTQKYTPFADVVKYQGNERKFQPVNVDTDDIACLVFSSGTTAFPKVICHSHHTLLLMLLRSSDISVFETTFHFRPFSCLSSIVLLGCVFASGICRLFCNEPTGEDAFKYITKYKVAYMFIAPYFTYKLEQVENIQEYDTSSLKRIVCSSETVPIVQMHKMSEMFPTAVVVLCYSIRELGIATTYQSKSEQKIGKKKVCSSGKVASGNQLKVVDLETEVPLSAHNDGEIRIKSASMMKGYYNEDSSQAFDADGFLKTGDVGYYDKEGFVYVINRIKEVFKSKSWPIIPAYIESVLLEHPAIAEAVVFGVPVHGEDGEVPGACIVLTRGYSLTEAEIDEFLKNEIGERERLRGGVTFLDTLPKGTSGKINRNHIRDFILQSNPK